MGEEKGIRLIAPIIPSSPESTIPTHYAEYGKGGWRTVASLGQRDAIPEERRELGMVVYVINEKELFIYTEEGWETFSTDNIHVLTSEEIDKIIDNSD